MSTQESATGASARLLYPMRIFGTTWCIALGSIYVWNGGTFQPWYLFVLTLALVYPHVARYIAGRLRGRRKLELRVSLIDEDWGQFSNCSTRH